MDADPIVAALFEGMRKRITLVFPDQNEVWMRTHREHIWRPKSEA
jgi:hypothetical protein